MGTANQHIVPGIYLVANVRLYREGLVNSLSRHPGVEVLGASSRADAMSDIGVLRADVILVDVSERDNLKLARQVSHTLPTLRIVALAVTESEADVLACAEAGICGYVTKDGTIDDLVAAVHRAISGEVACSARIAASLFRRVAALSSEHNGRATRLLLTTREYEIASMVARGMPNKEVARRLGLGAATIKNHVHNILQKMSIQRRGEIATLLAHASTPCRRVVPDAEEPALCRL
jgi:DNA-binding NarL/FixJ family response regulator